MTYLRCPDCGKKGVTLHPPTARAGCPPRDHFQAGLGELLDYAQEEDRL